MVSDNEGGTQTEGFESEVLRGKIGMKTDEVTGGWNKTDNGELHNMYSLPSLIRMINSMRMKLAGYVG
jgi:hypothetical protein